jgi:acetyl-CoA acyltransferase
MSGSTVRDAVIIDAVRSAVGKRNGALADVHAADLSAYVLQELVVRSGIDPRLVDDVIWGVANQAGDQASNLGRSAVLAAGWPATVPATTVDRRCGSSQQAIHFAAAGVISGQYEIAIAGGAEVMSRVPLGLAYATGLRFGPKVLERYGVKDFSQGLAAEMIADRWNLSRADLDQFGLRSHQRAAEAVDAGRFRGQIVPIELTDGTVFDTDEGIRRGGTAASMAALRPAFTAMGVVTAGTSSQISDGAAALLITTSESARKLGLRPIARIRSAVVVGDDPVIMLTAPIPATHKVLEQSGLLLSDIGTFEVNEAFASVALAWLAEFGVDEGKVNPDGGAIALGHPLGCTGARLMTTLVHRMRDQNIQFGLQTMCEGGGLANATVLELL